MFLCAAVASCGGAAPPISPTFTNVQQQVFTISCTFSSCHGGPEPQMGLSLTAPAYMNLINAPAKEVPAQVLVKPGSPAESYLYQKLSDAMPPVGMQMPVGQPLDEPRLDLVQQWIMLGAQND
jgi:hypothetical protein